MTKERIEHNRNRKSRIRQLPPDVKEELDRMLREDRLTQMEILEWLNGQCAERGEKPISQSGLSRYSKKMDEMGRKIRELREVSEVWVARLGSEPAGDISKLLLEIIRTLSADVMLKLQDEEAVDPAVLNQLALIAQRVEKSAMTHHQREKAMREAFARETAERVETAMANQGLTGETLDAIKREILGIGEV